MQKLGKLLATLFYLGFSPFAPGTLGSLAGVGVYLLVKGNTPLYFFITAVSLIAGFWSSSVCEKIFPVKDPPQIIIDEFASMLLVYLFIPFSVKALIIGFLLFRFFDVFKIPPIKKLEKLPSGYGIMLDDFAAAMLTNLVLQLLSCTRLLA